MTKRFNSLGIQMIPEFWHKKLFGLNQPQNSHLKINEILIQLKKSVQNIEFSSEKTENNLSDQFWSSLEKYFPKLKNDNVVDHVNYLGKHFSDPYLKCIDRLFQIPIHFIENKPTHWKFNSGWTRYEFNSQKKDYTCQPVKFPLEDSLVFDVEVSLDNLNHNRPTLAVALSNEAWYSWFSENLINAEQNNHYQDFNPITKITIDDLIPIGKFSNERLIVGHNVSFDRSYIKEQYHIDLDKTRFLDTMSLHICVSGLNQEQKLFVVRNNNPWNEIGSLNNLIDVYKLHCDREAKLTKEPRDIFVKGTLLDVYKNFSYLTSYCAEDVIATIKVLKALLPKFQHRFPNPVTLAGMLEMSVMYLPANQHSWNRYINESQSIYFQLKNEINQTLKGIASETCSDLKTESFKNDPWLWDLDWSKRSIEYKKSFKELADEDIAKKSFLNDLLETKKHLKKRQPILPGYPQWFVEFCENSKYISKIDRIDFKNIFDFDQFNISPKLRTIPKLLKLLWKDFPLYHDKSHGWGYLVPIFNEFTNFEYLNKLNFSTNENLFNGFKLEEGLKGVVEHCLFFKLPHKNGPNQRVGNPLSKDFIPKLLDGTLKPLVSVVNDVVNQQNMISYWENSSKRVLSQLVIPYNHLGDGAILPRVVVAGTVTRRAVEPTWLTASNSYQNRLGSELKGIIQCPNEFSYVGADVDSQELWIASLIGDAHHSGIQGSTGLGWMTLKGDRANSTDMHSVTANTINITRDEAKVLNYSRIYGSGPEFAARFLKQSNPNLSNEEAKLKAKKIFIQTKGLRKKKTILENHDDDDFFSQREWSGGSESSMFNRLEQIATSKKPTTPFLKCRISRALEPSVVGHDYMTSRINWVVQSSAVDFLHILLVSMKWFIESFKIDGRFSISIHDEIRYIIKNDHKFKAALALQFSNLITRSYFTSSLHLNDLPASIAFFSSIEIDKCLRKDPKDDCMTPSNSLGLSTGYGIGPGESLNMKQLLEKLQSCEDKYF